MSKFLKTLYSFLKQPSTYAGIGTIVAVAGAQKVGIKINDVGQAVALILGGGAITYNQSAPSDSSTPSAG
jgi:hypothetical protein